MARAAEAAGFHGFGCTDHPAPSQRWLEGGGHDALDPFVAMGFAASATERIRLIPNIVVLPYRNPFVVAKAGATLDLLSGGRFTLAVGAGYLKGEFAALGVDHAERNELFDEALAVLKAIWTGDDVSFEGRHFNARGITSHPRPMPGPAPADLDRRQQRPGPPAGGRLRRRLGPVPRAGRAGQDGPHRRPRHARASWPRPSTTCAAASTRPAATPAGIDIAFSNPAGGDPATDAFDADAHLEGLAALAALGVTWVQVGLPGDSLAHITETLERYGEQVIARA